MKKNFGHVGIYILIPISKIRSKNERNGSYSYTCKNYLQQPAQPGYWVSVKTKVRVLCTFTGTPFNIVRLKTHLRAASTAALRNSG